MSLACAEWTSAVKLASGADTLHLSTMALPFEILVQNWIPVSLTSGDFKCITEQDLHGLYWSPETNEKFLYFIPNGKYIKQNAQERTQTAKTQITKTQFFQQILKL